MNQTLLRAMRGGGGGGGGGGVYVFTGSRVCAGVIGMYQAPPVVFEGIVLITRAYNNKCIVI